MVTNMIGMSNKQIAKQIHFVIMPNAQKHNNDNNVCSVNSKINISTHCNNGKDRFHHLFIKDKLEMTCSSNKNIISYSNNEQSAKILLTAMLNWKNQKVNQRIAIARTIAKMVAWRDDLVVVNKRIICNSYNTNCFYKHLFHLHIHQAT